MDVRVAQANGIAIAYETSGDPSARPLLLVMGTGLQMLAWPEDLCRAFVDRDFFVIRFDNRDAGLSTHLHDVMPDVRAAAAGDFSSAAYTLEDMADDAAGLLEVLGLDSAHVLGVSLGAMVAQTLAARHPARVRSLTSIMSAPAVSVDWQAVEARPRATSREEYVEQALQMFRLIGSPGYPGDEAWLGDVAGRSWDRAHDPAGGVRQLLAIAVSGDRTEQLRSIRVPTLVVHGEADPVVPVAGAVPPPRPLRTPSCSCCRAWATPCRASCGRRSWTPSSAPQIAPGADVGPCGRSGGPDMSTVSGTMRTAESVRSAAADLVDTIEQHAPEIAEARRLPADLVGRLKRAGVFSMPMPRAWGGPEMTFREQVR